MLLVSDTHQSTRKLEELLAKYASEVQMVCHMGDHASDLMQFRAKYPTLSMAAVAGNCDYEPGLPPELVMTVSACLDDPNAVKRRILITHGHKHGVKLGMDRLAYYGKESGADAVFFGHTHFPVCTKIGGLVLMNPGSPVFPRGGGKAAYGLVEISPEGEISGELITL